MKIFVTGAGGVIGRVVVPALLAGGHAVTAAGRPSHRLDALANGGADIATLDLFDSDAAQRAMARHDVAINLATHIPSNGRMLLPGAWKEMDRIRREASRALADAAMRAGVRRFIQESFAPTYPDCGERWIAEEVPVQPARYNRSALEAEASADRFGQHGGAAVILRFALFYGPGDPFSQTVLDAVRRGWMPLPGPREAYVSMVTHHDAAAAVVAAVELPAGIYNVVDDEPMQRDAMAHALAGMLHVKAPRFLPPWVAKLGGSMGETIARSLRISNRKLRRASAWVPRYRSAVEGFAAVLDASREAERA